MLKKFTYIFVAIVSLFSTQVCYTKEIHSKELIDAVKNHDMDACKVFFNKLEENPPSKWDTLKLFQDLLTGLSLDFDYEMSYEAFFHALPDIAFKHVTDLTSSIMRRMIILKNNPGISDYNLKAFSAKVDIYWLFEWIWKWFTIKDFKRLSLGIIEFTFGYILAQYDEYREVGILFMHYGIDNINRGLDIDISHSIVNYLVSK